MLQDADTPGENHPSLSATAGLLLGVARGALRRTIPRNPFLATFLASCGRKDGAKIVTRGTREMDLEITMIGIIDQSRKRSIGALIAMN